MKVNTKIRYGLRAMISIACCEEPRGLLQKDIAEKQKLSNKYLDAIISSLKSKGLITTYRGKGSGYKLTRPANLISMYDIYTAFEPITVVECLDNPLFCEFECCCPANMYWSEMKLGFINILKSKSLEDVSKNERPCLEELESRNLN
ncbi:MAG: Rrf2 family transcriptional regulator [Paludibacter sp.]|nr:Rrf2 family transcriptional regulator [Paludibacter sp.]